MKKPTAAHLNAARRLHASEVQSAESVEERAAAAGRVCEKVFARLTPLVGKAAESALFKRCLTLTAPAFPCLGKVNLAGGAESPAGLLVLCFAGETPATIDESSVALLATLLALLSALIGAPLTIQVLRKAWPDLDVGALEEGTKG
jgi:hypothetical protein